MGQFEPFFQPAQHIGAGVAVPFRGSVEGLDIAALKQRPEAIGQMVGDVAGGQAQSTRPPTRFTGAIIVQPGAPSERRMGFHEGHEEEAAMVVEFAESVVAVGDCRGFAGDGEGGHGCWFLWSGDTSVVS